MNELFSSPEYLVRNCQSGALYTLRRYMENNEASTALHYLEMLNQLSPAYQQNKYVFLRQYIANKLTAMLSPNTDSIIEGDYGEAKESFMSLDEML